MKKEKIIKKRKLPLGFGKRLHDTIIRKNYTYSQIEKATGINHSNIIDYIKETMLPSAYNLYALCTYLDISADYLLGLEEKKND